MPFDSKVSKNFFGFPIPVIATTFLSLKILEVTLFFPDNKEKKFSFISSVSKVFGVYLKFFDGPFKIIASDFFNLLNGSLNGPAGSK